MLYIIRITFGMLINGFILQGFTQMLACNVDTGLISEQHMPTGPSGPSGLTRPSGPSVMVNISENTNSHTEYSSEEENGGEMICEDDSSEDHNLEGM